MFGEVEYCGRTGYWEDVQSGYVVITHIRVQPSSLFDHATKPSGYLAEEARQCHNNYTISGTSVNRSRTLWLVITWQLPLDNQVSWMDQGPEYV